MKMLPILICSLIAMVSFASAADTQVFPTSAGPVKITPLYHASTLIEAGGKTIYLDPATPAKLAGATHDARGAQRAQPHPRRHRQ